MMNKFLNNLADLIKTKTIVTILVTIVFCILALKGIISGDQFLSIFSVIIAFYFGTQYEKNKKSKEEK